MSIELDQMKQLLRKWRELDLESSHEIYLSRINDLTEGDLIDPRFMGRIQLVLQGDIVKRGWSFELKYNPDCPDPRNPYDATVDSSKSGGWGFGNDGFAIPLLEAYLHTLEGEPK